MKDIDEHSSPLSSSQAQKLQHQPRHCSVPCYFMYACLVSASFRCQHELLLLVENTGYSKNSIDCQQETADSKVFTMMIYDLGFYVPAGF